MCPSYHSLQIHGQEQWGQWRAAAAIVALASFLVGCAATIDEQHHIATFGQPTPLNPTGFANVLRITIDGNAGFSNVRYIAGTYNEYAADLFLNNVKSEAYDATRGASQGANTIFDMCLPSKENAGDGKDTSAGAGSDQKCSDAAGDTFLIIMSTNADAIAETIGAFAENEVTIKSLNYLLNRDVFDAKQVSIALEPQVKSERKAVLDSMDALFTGYESKAAASDSDELAILQMIAVAIDPAGVTSFTTLQEAKAWFSDLD